MPSSPAAQGASVRAESPIVPPRDPPGEGPAGVPAPGAVRGPALTGKRTAATSPLSSARAHPAPLFLATLPVASLEAAAGLEGQGRPERAGRRSGGWGTWALGAPAGGGLGAGGARTGRPSPGCTHLAAAERGRRRAGERAGSGNQAGCAGPRAVLFRSGRACPGRANPQALHTAPSRRRCHRPGLMSRRRAAPTAGPRRLSSGEPPCAPPQRKQRLSVPELLSGPGRRTRVETHVIRHPRSKSPDERAPHEKGGRRVWCPGSRKSGTRGRGAAPRLGHHAPSGLIPPLPHTHWSPGLDGPPLGLGPSL